MKSAFRYVLVKSYKDVRSIYVFLIITNALSLKSNSPRNTYVSYTKDIIKDRSRKRHEKLACTNMLLILLLNKKLR